MRDGGACEVQMEQSDARSSRASLPGSPRSGTRGGAALDHNFLARTTSPTAPLVERLRPRRPVRHPQIPQPPLAELLLRVRDLRLQPQQLDVALADLRARASSRKVLWKLLTFEAFGTRTRRSPTPAAPCHRGAIRINEVQQTPIINLHHFSCDAVGLIICHVAVGLGGFVNQVA